MVKFRHTVQWAATVSVADLFSFTFTLKPQSLNLNLHTS